MGTCKICGCTDNDCSQCIEKTGEPCYWVDPKKDLCSACDGNPDFIHYDTEINSIDEVLNFYEIAGIGYAYTKNDKKLGEKLVIEIVDGWCSESEKLVKKICDDYKIKYELKR